MYKLNFEPLYHPSKSALLKISVVFALLLIIGTLGYQDGFQTAYANVSISTPILFNQYSLADGCGQYVLYDGTYYAAISCSDHHVIYGGSGNAGGVSGSAPYTVLQDAVNLLGSTWISSGTFPMTTNTLTIPEGAYLSGQGDNRSQTTSTQLSFTTSGVVTAAPEPQFAQAAVVCSSSSTATTGTCVYASHLKPQDVLVVAINSQSATLANIKTPTDTLLTSFTAPVAEVDTRYSGSAGSYAETALFIGHEAAGGADTVTFGFNSAAIYQVVIYELINGITVTSYDSGSSSGTASTPTAPAVTSYNPVVQSLIIASASEFSSVAMGALTAGSGYTLTSGVSGATASLGVEYAGQSAVSTTSPFTLASSSSGNWQWSEISLSISPLSATPSAIANLAITNLSIGSAGLLINSAAFTAESIDVYNFTYGIEVGLGRGAVISGYVSDYNTNGIASTGTPSADGLQVQMNCFATTTCVDFPVLGGDFTGQFFISYNSVQSALDTGTIGSAFLIGCDSSVQTCSVGGLQVSAGTCAANQFVTSTSGGGVTCSAVGWNQLTSFPAACAAGSAVTSVSTTLACSAFIQADATASCAANQFLTSQATNTAVCANAYTLAYATAAQSISTTVLTDATSLSVSASASTVYKVQALIIYKTGTAGTGINIGFFYPTGSTMEVCLTQPLGLTSAIWGGTTATSTYVSGTTTTTVIFFSTHTSTLTHVAALTTTTITYVTGLDTTSAVQTNAGCLTTTATSLASTALGETTDQAILINGYVSIASTAGSFGISYASTSNAQLATIEAGSWIELTPLSQ